MTRQELLETLLLESINVNKLEKDFAGASAALWAIQLRQLTDTQQRLIAKHFSDVLFLAREERLGDGFFDIIRKNIIGLLKVAESNEQQLNQPKDIPISDVEQQEDQAKTPIPDDNQYDWLGYRKKQDKSPLSYSDDEQYDKLLDRDKLSVSCQSGNEESDRNFFASTNATKNIEKDGSEYSMLSDSSSIGRCEQGKKTRDQKERKNEAMSTHTVPKDKSTSRDANKSLYMPKKFPSLMDEMVKQLEEQVNFWTFLRSHGIYNGNQFQTEGPPEIPKPSVNIW